ncbi:hypothetical protein jhhlp_000894 [Lomentospora prolificans]|uniref:Uncharacterized protein n=1 Tax=Lomentospora prolificans TaxID=41688 RepID=A0A2N3NJQ8_9PEZI|nr:hypothetical protein jhhlp_000894 [Lomentospora prolificans]
MAPPTAPLNLDVEAISGICGPRMLTRNVVVVFSPQILQNFQRGSTEGLSIQFLIVWLLGDVFNILGSVIQGVLPTMIILAIYYTIADIVLLLQCFYYRGFTLRDEVTSQPTERSRLLPEPRRRTRRGSNWSNLSPAVPIVPEPFEAPPATPSVMQTLLWNTLAVIMVCGAGVLGWFLSRKAPDAPDTPHDSEPGDSLTFSLWGQIFGYLCAALYILSRIPQLILNYRRKSTDGLSMLFFLFACLGNITYVLSIFAYEPNCSGDECAPGEASRIYGKYILVNLSWLAGSLVTLLLDFGVFTQYFVYNKDDEEHDVISEYSDDDSIDKTPWERPLLARGNSTYG